MLEAEHLDFGTVADFGIQYAHETGDESLIPSFPFWMQLRGRWVETGSDSWSEMGCFSGSESSHTGTSASWALVSPRAESSSWSRSDSLSWSCSENSFYERI